MFSSASLRAAFSVSISFCMRRCGLTSAAATVCQPYKMMGPSGFASRPRQAGRPPDTPRFCGGLPPPRRKCCFRSRSLMGQLVSWVPDNGNFNPRGRFWRPALVDLAGVLPPETRNRVPVTGSRFQRHSWPCLRRFGGWVAMLLRGEVSRVAKGADCKSAASWLRRFESFLPHQDYQRLDVVASQLSAGMAFGVTTRVTSERDHGTGQGRDWQ